MTADPYALVRDAATALLLLTRIVRECNNPFVAGGDDDEWVVLDWAGSLDVDELDLVGRLWRTRGEHV